MDHEIKAKIIMNANARTSDVDRLAKNIAQMLRNLPPCSDQHETEARKMIAAFAMIQSDLFRKVQAIKGTGEPQMVDEEKRQAERQKRQAELAKIIADKKAEIEAAPVSDGRPAVVDPLKILEREKVDRIADQANAEATLDDVEAADRIARGLGEHAVFPPEPDTAS